jgi:hypothetical protein
MWLPWELNVTVLWNVMPCGLIEVRWHFCRGICSLCCHGGRNSVLKICVNLKILGNCFMKVDVCWCICIINKISWSTCIILYQRMIVYSIPGVCTCTVYHRTLTEASLPVISHIPWGFPGSYHILWVCTIQNIV